MWQFSGKTENFDYFGPNIPKNVFWNQNFKNLGSDSESVPPRFCTCQFLVKADNFEIFSLNFGKLSIKMRCFSSNTVEGVILVLTAQRTGWRLKWAGWRWMELGWAWWRSMGLGGGGWSSVEVVTRFSNTPWKQLF